MIPCVRHHVITHVGVQSETRGHAHWEVREETHEEGRQCGHGGSGSDEVPLHLGDTGEVRIVGDAEVRLSALTGASRVGDDGSVHGDLRQKRMSS